MDFADRGSIPAIQYVTVCVFPRFLRAYTRLDGLFFDEFLKHVPIIHPVLGRKQITEDHQLATIACALGSLAAEDAPSGYMCATWMRTYKRVSAKIVSPSDILYCLSH